MKTAKQHLQLIIGIIFIIVALTFRFIMSMIGGRAGAEPSYDDITYMLDGKYRIEQIKLDFLGGLYSWIATPPHSPMSSFIAFVSELGFDSYSPAIYFINGIFICLASLFLIYKTIRNFVYSVFITGILIASPIGPMLMFNFRPDCLYALISSAMIISVREKNSNTFLRQSILLSGLLILIKPSFIIFTLIDAAIVYLLYRKWSGFSGLNLKKSLFTLTMFLFMLSWYFIHGLKEIIQYIINNTTGASKTLWTSETYLTALRSNVQGTTAQIGIVFSALLLIFIVYVFQKNIKSAVSDKAVVSLLIVGAVNLGISIYSLINNPFFYLTTFIPILTATCVLAWESSAGKLKDLRKNSRQLYWVLTVGIIFALFPSTEWSAAAIRSEGPVNQKFASLIKSQRLDSVTFLYAGGLNSDTTNWYLGNYKMNVINEGLNYQNEDAALQVLERALNSKTTIVTRITNYAGFPSDKLQEFNNNYLRLSNVNRYKIYQIENYFVWIP
jgi:hypothetical protein